MKVDLFVCGCHSEGIVVENDKETREVYFSLWDRGFAPRKYDLRYRLRFIWRILTKGFPWTDSVILSYEDTQQLIEKLHSFIGGKRMLIEIREPIWKTRSVGINKSIINANEDIEVTISYKDKDGRRVFPNNYLISGSKALTFPTMERRGVTLVLIPIIAMQEIKE